MKSDEAPKGGGSGGGPCGSKEVSTTNNYELSANQITFTAAPPIPPAGVPEKSVIALLAAGTGVDGMVDVRGSQGVRITAGPAPGLPAGKATTKGVTIAAGQADTVSIERGLFPGTDQRIKMTPQGITVNAGSMPVTIESLREITLSVAGGAAKITISPTGVKIEGMTVKIEGTLMTEVKGLNTSLKADAFNIIGGALTKIG